MPKDFSKSDLDDTKSIPFLFKGGSVQISRWSSGNINSIMNESSLPRLAKPIEGKGHDITQDKFAK
jgi:hypothetical protein